jgi:isoquinoline 1-oxidoreductase beta subunit
MRDQSPVSRRAVLKAGALASTGLVLGFVVPGARRFALAQAPEGGGTPPPLKPTLPAPNAFLRIAPDDSVTILLAHSEMGQGIWTALPMLVAEELECDWSRVKVEHAPAAPAYAHTGFGIQATGGSTSVWTEFDRYRQVGALARDMLVRAAAERWKVDASTCQVASGIVSSGHRSARFGELAEAAAALTPANEIALKPRTQWQLIGKRTRRLDSKTKLDGSAVFGLDVRLPGMRYAMVARGPVFGAKVKSFDAEAARAIKGVREVVQISNGVAVIADHTHAARLGRDALAIEWDLGPNAGLDSDTLRSEYAALAKTAGAVAKTQGDAAAALAAAKNMLEAEYEVPYLAHACMEPLNCTLRVADGKAELWTGTQFQTLDQGAVAQVLGVAPENVAVHTTFLGGGFGRRANPVSDFVREAAEVAKAAKDPVQVVWSREDDMRGGYYRPMYLHRLRAALGADGGISAWHDTVVGQSILAGTPFAAMIKDGVDESSVEGAHNSPYLGAIAAHRVELHSPTPGVPVLWWRSVGHTHTAFAVESFIDELAHAAKKDPLAFRRALLAKAGAKRHLAVLDKAAAGFGWNRPLAKGRGKGIAVHESFGSYVAQAAEVSVEGATVRVHRVVAAIDCGLFVNPLTIEAQVEGAIAYGLSALLRSEITFKEGRVQQSNFHDYPVLRIQEMPKVEVHIVDSGEKPGGVGEPGTPPIFAAVCNAIFACTGKRIRRLPLSVSLTA